MAAKLMFTTRKAHKDDVELKLPAPDKGAFLNLATGNPDKPPVRVMVLEHVPGWVTQDGAKFALQVAPVRTDIKPGDKVPPGVLEVPADRNGIRGPKNPVYVDYSRSFRIPCTEAPVTLANGQRFAGIASLAFKVAEHKAELKQNPAAEYRPNFIQADLAALAAREKVVMQEARIVREGRRIAQVNESLHSSAHAETPAMRQGALAALGRLAAKPDEPERPAQRMRPRPY